MFADVILPLPLANRYTYLLPHEMEGAVQTGCRVIVPFGKKKFYTGIVIKVHDTAPEGDYEMKAVSEVLDAHPVVLPSQLKLWEWIAEYYLCTLGDVYKAAMPSAMKLESETLVEINPQWSTDNGQPSTTEQRVLDLLSDGKVRDLGTLQRESGASHAAVAGLLKKGAILVKEEVKRTYKPKTETYVRLTANFRSEKMLHLLQETLKRAPQQQALLKAFMDELRVTSDKLQATSYKLQATSYELQGRSGEVKVSRKALLARGQATTAILNQLVKKGVFELYECEVGRLGKETTEILPLNPLNSYQQEALGRIEDCFREKSVCLLHGVTSSGKTEIYIHLIEKALQAGQQVLYLLPEIALTTQITERLKRVFGSRLGDYHSKFPDAERVEIWQKQLSAASYDIILGVRSSVFLPFQRLGLVIVDEEHENTYKQQDPAPRYHARNAAIVLAARQGAKVLLGTATPSIESYYNALTGKYGLVQLTHRHRSIQLPDIQVVDIGELRHKRRMNGPFSPELLARMREALERKEQVILFQNRRGFAPMVECKTCGWVPRCKNCDVSLTYHKGLNQLTCHYCGYTYEIPRACPACESTDIRHRGFGTERIEDCLQPLFPEARIARMDLDTTRTRQAYERIIHDFQQGETDILIGTQMVSKGLDFEHVSVVGILDADTMMNFPDFRSHERAFQLMAQVAGRAGRKHKQGLVILQTASKEAPVISQVVHNDYQGLYDDQLAERMLFRFPPFYRLIYVYLKHRDAALADTLAHETAELLRCIFGDRILGPDAPPVGRIQTYFIRKIVVKMEQTASINKVREQLHLVRERMLCDARFKSCVIYFDVDPG